MSYWILPLPLTQAQREAAIDANALLLPTNGLSDLSRAQDVAHVETWLRQITPEAAPEKISVMAQHYWRLGHELLPEDTIIVRLKEGSAYMIGEITGVYRKETKGENYLHVLPVKWHTRYVAAASFPALSIYAGYEQLTEITSENVLYTLKPHIPALRKGNAGFFKWLGIGILIFELLYFWPRS